MKLNLFSTAQQRYSLLLPEHLAKEARLFRIILMPLATLRLWHAFERNFNVVPASSPCWFSALTASCLVTHSSALFFS